MSWLRRIFGLRHTALVIAKTREVTISRAYDFGAWPPSFKNLNAIREDIAQEYQVDGGSNAVVILNIIRLRGE